MTEANEALWLRKPRAALTVGPAPYPRPTAGEIVIRVRAVAVNPVDGLPGLLYRLVMPHLTFPAVLGWDVAGEVVEVGADVSDLKPGDRVLGAAQGLARNRPSEGAFQKYTVLRPGTVSPIPDDLPFEQAVVLPFTVSIAATGLFDSGQLALSLPTVNPPDRAETVIVWGASTSVGSNAVQLARGAGYRVLATASPRNASYVQSLGAENVIDYRNPNAVQELLDVLGDRPLAGTLAIGDGSLPPALSLASQALGRRRVATAAPTPLSRARAVLARRRGIHLGLIRGATLEDGPVGPGIFSDFLPVALASGLYRAAPDALVVGEGLAAIPDAIAQLGKGVSARKLVVRL